MWGALAAATPSEDPLPAGLEQKLCDFADLVAQALANADAYEKLAASRARVVEVGDAERRRLERNLHDGAQQRLVSVALELNMVAARLERDPRAARELLATAQEDLSQGLAELRELARGIHPIILTERGLGPALDALLARAAVPVEIAELPEERLTAPVEAAAYYVVAEAVTNVGRYAGASHATVSVGRSNGTATSSSPTMASAAPTRPAGRAYAGSRPASRPSTAASTSRAHRDAAPGSRQRSPWRDSHQPRRRPPEASSGRFAPGSGDRQA